jgi:hypothetical protein
LWLSPEIDIEAMNHGLNKHATQSDQEDQLLTGFRDQKGSREVEELDGAESIAWREKPPGGDNS